MDAYPSSEAVSTKGPTEPRHGTASDSSMGTLSRADVNRLADYNAETSRGLVHTADYADEMAALQRVFNEAGIVEAPEPMPPGIAQRDPSTGSWKWPTRCTWWCWECWKLRFRYRMWRLTERG